MPEQTVIPAVEEAAAATREAEAEAQREFNAQWDIESIPACDQGMVLLKAFADAHPGAFALGRGSNFVNITHPMITGTARWHTYAQHVSTCSNCSEV